MTRFGNAQEEPEDVEADELAGDEVDDGLELDTTEWEDESTGGDPLEPSEAPEEPAEPAAAPAPRTKPKTPRRRK